jgi:hypothetical protein
LPALALRQPLELAEAAIERSLALRLQALSLNPLLAHPWGLDPLGALLADPLILGAFGTLGTLLAHLLVLSAFGLSTLLTNPLILGALRLGSLGSLGALSRSPILGAFGSLGTLRRSALSLGSFGTLGALRSLGTLGALLPLSLSPLAASLGTSTAAAIRFLDLSLAILAAAPIAGLRNGWSRNRQRGNAGRENQPVHGKNSVV